MYIGTFFKIIFSVILSALALIPDWLGFSADFAGSPTVILDASELAGDVTSGASGYLYGLSEDGVPSYNMVQSLDVSSVSAKTQGGLQHPIGEVGDVAAEVMASGHCDYIVVYLQDMYSTWYYDWQNINDMKAAGTYDWKTYLTGTYFPLIKQSMESMMNSEYADRLVYCIFNECDNGIWFGEWIVNEDGSGWNDFNEQGRKNFNEAWKMTFDYVRSIDPDAVIGGPGNYEYNAQKTEEVLSFAAENDCVPDVMIYHELGDRSVYDWEANVSEFRAIEEKYGIDADTPIIITEYGRMQDNGDPAMMLKYIICTENTKVYSNQAYWLLADNLSNTCADYNTPNSAWWVYRWYTSMDGQTMKSRISDPLHSDLGKALKGKRELRYQQFMGMGTINDEKDKLDILVSGADYNGRVVVKNLKDTELYGKNVKIEITAVTYQGLLGEVCEPETVKVYTEKCRKKLRIPLEMRADTAYHIVVTATDEEIEYENDNLYVRYEAEDGTLTGNAYTYDSAYATTGEINGMVGGMENQGDGVEITIKADEDGEYFLRLVYGNSNDGPTSADRTFSVVNFSIDGQESQILFANTVRSELTSAYDMTLELTKGEHTLKFSHNKGTIVLDSILMKKVELAEGIYCEKDDDKESTYLVLAPYDSYYHLNAAKETKLDVDGAATVTDADGNALVYLRRGINYIKTQDNTEISVEYSSKTADVITLSPSDAVLSDTAQMKKNEVAGVDYITGISSESGSAEYSVNAHADGTYKLTVTYSNNRENGVHDYNVDLVEDFITISINGEKTKNLYCRNTYSNDNFTTVTTNINLKAGENKITFSNDGANKFNDNVTFAPDIATVTINPVKK